MLRGIEGGPLQLAFFILKFWGYSSPFLPMEMRLTIKRRARGY